MLISDVQQSYSDVYVYVCVCVYIFMYIFFSLIGYYKILSKVSHAPYAIQ